MAEDSETDRTVYVQRIDPNQREAYIDAHENVPEDVTEAMTHGSVTDFELYIHDNIAVCVLEAEDISTYIDTMTSSESVEEWERYVARFKQEGVDVDSPPDEQIPFMRRIWSFDPENE